MLPALDAAVGAGLPVVVASRCEAGGNFENTYSMAGSESDLARRGALFAGPLSGPKARLRLLVCLALGLEPGAVFPVDGR
jgi:L-asparaginase